MKYCEKCNMGFTDEKIYCPKCGSELILPVETDIFGDPIERPYKKQVIYDENKRVYAENKAKENPYSNLKSINYEIFALLSLGFMFIPLYGTILSGLSFYKNFNNYNSTKKGIGYLVLSCFCLIFSLVFTYLLYKYGVLESLTSTENV